jgi:hypothetical protein
MKEFRIESVILHSGAYREIKWETEIQAYVVLL